METMTKAEVLAKRPTYANTEVADIIDTALAAMADRDMYDRTATYWWRNYFIVQGKSIPHPTRERDARALEDMQARDADIEQLRAANARLQAVVERLESTVTDIASDKNLRTRTAGYHARRVALTCGAVLAELDGMYQKHEAVQSAREAT